MSRFNSLDETRRDFLRKMALTPVVLAPTLLMGSAGCQTGSGLTDLDETSDLSPTPACEDDDDDPTPAQTEGPYFTRNSPERSSLLQSGVDGTKLVITGSVLTLSCQPVASALLDFWQADEDGQYDNSGYRLRGHQFTDANGAFRLETIVPGLYPGRTRHIHVKVQAPGRSVLTTQLYFPGESRNASDGIYSPELLLSMAEVSDGRGGRFNFVLNIP